MARPALTKRMFPARLGNSTAYDNEYSTYFSEAARLHTYRTAGRDRDHRDSRRHAAPRAQQGENQSPWHRLHEQPEATGARLADLRARFQRQYRVERPDQRRLGLGSRGARL